MSGQELLSTYELSLEDFQQEFDPKIFIQKLTSPLFSLATDDKKNDDAKDFDPRPYQQLFENAIDQLHVLRQQVDEDIRGLIANTKMAENDHKAQLKELNSKFHMILHKFQHLDQRISKVSHTAVRTGQQLESVDQNRRKTNDGKRTIRQFLEFNTGKKDKIDPIFRGESSDNQLAKAARQIQKLKKIADEIQSDKTSKATALIHETAKSIEKKLLKRFMAEMDANNLKRMKDLAKTLWCFEKKQVVVDYVRRVVETVPEPETEMKGLSAIPPSVFRDKSKQFYALIIKRCKEWFRVIGRVFPNPIYVTVQVLKKLFNDRIKLFISLAVERSDGIGDYLQVLEMAHTQTVRAAKEIESHKNNLALSLAEAQSSARGLGIHVDKSSMRLAGRGNPSMSSTAESNANHAIGTAEGGEEFKFDERVESIFDPFRKDYLGKELENLTDKCRAVVEQAIVLDEKQREELDDKSIFGRRKKGAKGSLALKHWVLQALNAPGEAKFNRESSSPPRSPFSRKDTSSGLPEGSTVQVTNAVLQNLTLALKRAERLGGDVADCCNRLAQETWSLLLESYVSVALDLAEQVLPDEDPREEPDTRFFLQTTQAINMIIHQLTSHYQDQIVPRLEDDPNTKTRSRQSNQSKIRKIEQRLIYGLTLCLNAAIKHFEKLLARLQRPGDFKPKDENHNIDCTDTCEAACAFVTSQADCAMETLEGQNLDAYLAEFGRRVYHSLKTHLRKFSVSPLGAMVVSMDVKKYQATVQSFHIDEVSAKFAILYDMTSLLLLPTEQLGMVIQQRLLAVSKEELHEFIKSRADYQKQRIQIMSALNL